MKSLQIHGFIPNLSSPPPLPQHRISAPKPSSKPRKIASLSNSPATHLALTVLLAPRPLPALAADKLNIEAVVVSIDDFFNRNPFFVAGVTFIWLVVIPLTEEYLKKYKFIAPIDAFRKLRDDPGSQLIDIRKRQSVAFMAPPSLKMFGKSVVQLEFSEGDEDGFVKEVMKRFGDPGNTVLCVLDNFDGNSLKVAELLFKNGFKEAYAVKGGLRGKDGWLSIQEKLLPPSLHVYPRNKKSKSSLKPKLSSQTANDKNNGNGQAPSSGWNMENGSMKSTEADSQTKLAPERSSSTFPKYPDPKPPTSPSPNKP